MPHARQNQFHLIVRRELRLLGMVKLDDDRLTIGRSHNCNVRLDDEDVAPTHAELHRENGGWKLLVRDEIRGVRVNGRKVDQAALTPGDVIDIRPFSMNFLDGNFDAPVPNPDTSIHLSNSDVVTTYVRDARADEGVARQRLDDLYALARLILARKDNGSFWQIMHAALQRCLAAERCVLVGVDERGGFFRLAPRTRAAGVEKPLGVSLSVLRDTVAAGQAMLIQQVFQDHRYAEAPSLLDSRSGSVICVPVTVGDRVRAVLYADRELARAPFQPGDLDFAIAALDLAAGAVSMDELHAQSRELSRIKGRIDLGREMQKMLFPSPIAQPPWGEIAALNRPADQMSGDIYDVRKDAKGRFLVTIADVSGKGVPAAFVTAILQSAWRSALHYHDDLQEIMASVNTALGASIPSDCFATMTIVRWSLEGDRAEIANAGHHPALWLTRDGRVDEFPTHGGVPLGIMPEWREPVVTRDAREDLALVLCSDGLTECRNAVGAELALAGLSEALKELDALTAGEIASGLAARASAHCAPSEPADDVTVVVVKRRV
ncbi:MAG TPA: SpoIIE family protein phosphatase [Phycisphaerae bacterium]|nr:SpoIIE family protein phosphatase [Phycisphaerae bacterium]